jgi:[protein-PII] uridylyltransferase
MLGEMVRHEAMPWSADMFWAPPDSEARAFAAFVAEFGASMPARYKVLFDPRSVALHAGVAFRRGTEPARAEVWRDLADRSAALCIVADDRPGLLSAIAAALTSHRLDVITALVFSRPLPDGGSEAVDLLWVRRDRADDMELIDAEEAVSIGEVLAAILSGRISIEEIASRRAARDSGAACGVEVRFANADQESRAVLGVEAPDRPGILLTITFELYKQGAQIIHSLVRTVDGRAYNEFEIAEFSGAALSTERRDQIREAIVAALTLG